ncbi:XrtA/PEP-CTERM system histidine kinase PrsK [Rhodoferax sp. PAMC 29310]|uniref:XrtA/PEP-CTERM system histidine kinase PrsK n=1 Tax=Rhodoferax sp. PAMC 29310 TaxID=2822760 RepID=UPI001B3341B4|nr:XrtA/PEP-CTERM system histidine kinase PrsK [Rhodoferax sp. PAMC 29310]
MLLTAWSFGLVGVTYLAFFLRLLQLGYLSAPQELPKVLLLVAVGGCTIWGAAGFALVQTSDPVYGLVSALADIFRYGAWFAFLLALYRPSAVQKSSRRFGQLASVAIVLVSFSFFSVLMLWLGSNQWGDPSRFMLFSSMAQSVYGMVLLEQIFRNVEEDSRWNLKPLFLGLAGGFLFDLYIFSQAVLFNSLDQDALSIRGGVHALVAPLLVLSSTRRSDWIQKIRLSPKAAFHSATLLIAGLYLLFISGIGYYIRYFGGDWGRALQLGLVFLALVVLMVLALSGALRAKLRVMVGKHFFRYRYDYREEWLRFTNALSVGDSPQAMGQQVVRGLADMLESPGGGLWMQGQNGGQLTQVAHWNFPATNEQVAISSSLCQFLVSSGWVVNLGEFRSFPRRYEGLALPEWLRNAASAWLVVPLFVGDDLIGFAILATPRTHIDVNWEINDLLKTAGRQAASFLAQMQTTEALLEVRKFDSFNRMSAFVVHDLKNIVTQLSLMMKNAKRLSGNPEFQQDMLMTVENSLDRMRQLMLQLREGATPPGKAFGVNLEEIATRIAGIALRRDRVLEIEVKEAVLTRGHEERLERVIGHMVQNAFDATNAGGRVWLSLERANGQAQIVVGDTGQGMTPEFIQNRLFKPFQTTKSAGMGIGAYESFQYVQELGGRIDVQSEPNVGTTVTIQLPLFETRKESDLHTKDVS